MISWKYDTCVISFQTVHLITHPTTAKAPRQKSYLTRCSNVRNLSRSVQTLTVKIYRRKTSQWMFRISTSTVWQFRAKPTTNCNRISDKCLVLIKARHKESKWWKVFKKICLLNLLWYHSLLLYTGMFRDFLTIYVHCIAQLIFTLEYGFVLLVRWPLFQIRPLFDKHALGLTTI